ncbi:DUF2087 domain-containing protein [Clostridium sp. 'deep sea']|uniref:DUF2087 domain-containing protein n=1 Tax=Clostridium sp. 'deep sea' TaxID=2779445 RepID=UPI001896867A|nr:DUF2087 domain-containing protein [Clostridium sp. 'deep sea']QOR34011.1 DUF2087 domain-containing protein [Clostridium sp. 'deep sea']
MNNYFNEASLNDLKRGYIVPDNSTDMICLICGEKYEKDIIYTMNDRMLLGQKAIIEHVKSAHNSTFNFLINLEKKHTGISESQKDMLIKFYNLANDTDIAKELGVSKSTVRNYRFRLREKAKQAKVFLALMELLESRVEDDEKLIDYHKEATMVDDRYVITEAEYKKTIEKYFSSDGSLRSIPRKQKRKLIVLREIASSFETNKTYDEKEVNEKLEKFNEDYVSLRRYLIEYQFLKRENDGSKYWVTL